MSFEKLREIRRSAESSVASSRQSSDNILHAYAMGRHAAILDILDLDPFFVDDETYIIATVVHATDHQEIGEGAGKMLRAWTPVEKTLARAIVEGRHESHG